MDGDEAGGADGDNCAETVISGGNKMAELKDADRIREFVYQNYISPAKEKGLSEVSVLAREIHDRMGFTKNNYPNICGALTRPLMKKKYELKNIKREPPSNGPNVKITFVLKDIVIIEET
jgi:hypothetical protein